MGQYYKPMFLTKNERGNDRPAAWIYSHDIKTKYTRDDGKSFMMGCGLKLMEHSWMNNPMVQIVESLLLPGGNWHKQPIVWAGDYAEPEKETMDHDGVIRTHNNNLYDFCDDHNKITPKIVRLAKRYRYILNHTTNQYVDKTKVPDNDGWHIHPLPLLTCEGNGQGGGDYRGNNPIIGTWARHTLSVDAVIPEGYTELIFDITE